MKSFIAGAILMIATVACAGQPIPPPPMPAPPDDPASLDIPRRQWEVYHPKPHLDAQHQIRRPIKIGVSKPLSQDEKTRIQMLAQMDNAKRAWDAAQAEQRRQQAVEFERNRRRSRFPEMLRAESERQRDLAHHALGEGFWLKYEHPELYDAESLEFCILDRVASKHKVARAEAIKLYPAEFAAELDRELPRGSWRGYEVRK